jgi:hypothetical protein
MLAMAPAQIVGSSISPDVRKVLVVLHLAHDATTAMRRGSPPAHRC